MDLRFTPEETAFREEVRAFIRDNLPAETRERMRLGYPPRKQDTIAWMRILNAHGWAAFNWPKEYGGPGWTAIQRMIRFGLKEGVRCASTNSPPSRWSQTILCLLDNAMQPISLQSVFPVRGLVSRDDHSASDPRVVPDAFAAPVVDCRLLQNMDKVG